MKRNLRSLISDASIINWRKEEFIKGEKIDTAFVAVNGEDVCVRQVVNGIL